MSDLKYRLMIVAGRLMYVWEGRKPLTNTVVFSNFSGKKYSDNPMYISEKLHELSPDTDIVWLRHKGYEFDTPDYVRVVDWPSKDMTCALATAKVWVDSHLKPAYVRKRKEQFYIETWHGGLGMKKIEGDADGEVSFKYRKDSLHNTAMADLFISNCAWLSAIYRRAFGYKGQILECGYPKNDIFFNDHEAIAQKVREDLDASGRKIFLYAPTFRDTESPEWLTLDLKKVKDFLDENAMGGCDNWLVIYKMHPLTTDYRSVMSQYDSEGIKDATDYPNMQELILATDMYVTDYSSGIFDFAYLRRPGFLYASDVKAYVEQERGLYFDITKDLPFPFADTTEALLDQMRAFNDNDYQKAIDAYFEDMGMKETGHAADDICRVIMDHLD